MPDAQVAPTKTAGGFDYYDIGKSETVKLPTDMPLKRKLEIIKRRQQLAFEKSGTALPEAHADIAAGAAGLNEIGPDMVRFGVPLLYDALSKGKSFVGGQAVVDGLAELGAREYEDYNSSKAYGTVVNRLHSHAENVVGGAGAAAVSYGVGKTLPPILEHIMQGGRWALSKMAKRFLTPKRMEPDILGAARMLKRVSTPADIYGMTLGQLNRGTQNWMTFLEDTFRSSLFGKGRFFKNDLRNITAAENLFDDWLRANAYAVEQGIGEVNALGMPAHKSYAFGKILRDSIEGEVEWTNGLKTVLYTRFRNLMTDIGATVNMNRVGRFLADRVDVDEYNLAWRLVDDLVGARGRAIGNASFDAVGADAALAMRTRLNQAINALKKNPKNAYKVKIFTEVRDMIRDSMYDSARIYSDQAYDAIKLADDYTGSVGEAFNKKMFQALKTRLDSAPEGVIGAIATEGKHLSNLQAMEDYFIRKTVPGVSEAAGRAESVLGREMFEKTVIEPLRHSILSEAVKNGQLLGPELKKILGRYDPAFIRKVFGEEGFQHLSDIASTLTVMQQAAGAGGNKVFIQLIQGGALTALGMNVARGGDVKASAGGALLVLLAPGVLGRMLTNKAFNQLLVDYSLGTIPAHTFSSRVATILSSQAIAKRIRDVSELPGKAREFFQNTWASLTAATDQNTAKVPITREDIATAMSEGMMGP